MFGTCEYDLKIYAEIWGIPPLKSGSPKPPIFDDFRRLRNLMAILTANLFVVKHDIDNRGKSDRKYENQWRI